MTTEARRRQTAAKVAALTLANAFIFQEQLAAANKHVKTLKQVLSEKDPVASFEQHWAFICSSINYVPIFWTAREILLALPNGTNSEASVRALAGQALAIASKKAALRHDLMGRIYHWLLHDAKYLGTYYTSVSGATLLLKIALAKDRWTIDWGNPQALAQLRIADLACGTGTLLMAASQAITDNFVREAAKYGSKIDQAAMRSLHKSLMEDILHGYDVLPSAVHLTASTLALLAPEIAFQKMQLYSLPLGKLPDEEIYLGSIEYLDARIVHTQFDLMGLRRSRTAAGAITGAGMTASIAPLPDLDLCVMNPPFVRSVGGNLLFGSFPRDRTEMQKNLSRRLKSSKDGPVLCNTTAGLGSVFTAIADRHIKAGGRIALVLPAAVTTGVAWRPTRELLEEKYVLETVIASHQAGRWAFSENTAMSEVLIVARKKSMKGPDGTGNAVFVNLWVNPHTSAEALSIADAVLRSESAEIGQPNDPKYGIAPLVVGLKKYGESVSFPLSDLTKSPWIGCAFAQTELVRAAWYLRKGVLRFPGYSKCYSLPIVPLGKIAEIGPDRRDVNDAFLKTKIVTNYPAFWGHRSDEVTTLAAAPNLWLSPRAKPAPGRPRRPVELVWPKAGRIMVAERMWLTTQRLPVVILQKPALANVWWPTCLKSDEVNREKALALWLNSTLGLLLLIGHRVPTRGPWVQFKKPVLREVPVLDVLSLGTDVIDQLAHKYDEICETELKPLSEMDADEVRAQIDARFSILLNVPDLMPFAEMLAREPIIADESLQIVEVTEKEVASRDQLSLF